MDYTDKQINALLKALPERLSHAEGTAGKWLANVSGGKNYDRIDYAMFDFLRAIAPLSPAQKLAVARYLTPYSVRHYAHLIGISRQALDDNITRARAAIKIFLNEGWSKWG